jgi:hypothetical protein
MKMDSVRSKPVPLEGESGDFIYHMIRWEEVCR